MVGNNKYQRLSNIDKREKKNNLVILLRDSRYISILVYLVSSYKNIILDQRRLKRKKIIQYLLPEDR